MAFSSSYKPMIGPVFANERSKRIFDQMKRSGRHGDILAKIYKDIYQLHGDANSLSSGALFTISSVVVLEIYFLSDLDALRDRLLRAISRTHSIASHRKATLKRQVRALVLNASREVNTDTLSTGVEVPIESSSEIYSSIHLRFDVIGGSMVMVYASFTPSEYLRDFFADIARNQINTTIQLRWARTAPRVPFPIIKKGNDIKSDLIAHIDNQVLADASRIIRKVLGAGICLNCFGGVPAVQSFIYRERINHNTSSGPGTFFTLLYQAGVGVRSTDYFTEYGDTLIEHRPEASHGLRALCKFVSVSGGYIADSQYALALFAAKEIYKLLLYRLSLIEREYVSLSVRRKLSGLTKKRFELYRLKTVHGIFSDVIDKKSRQPYGVAQCQSLNDFKLNFQVNCPGYYAKSKKSIMSLRLQFQKSLQNILDNSETVRDESNAKFQSYIGCFTILSGCLALALSIAAMVVSIVLAPLAQVRLERWVNQCFTVDSSMELTERPPDFFCANLKFMK